MKGVTTKTTVSLSLSADDWELFTNSMDCTAVAEAINRGVEKAINESPDYPRAAEAAHAVMRQYGIYGACDSEPLWHLEKILAHIYDGRE